MNIKILKTFQKTFMEPLTCTRTLSECPVAGKTLQELQKDIFAKFADNSMKVVIQDNFYPSAKVAQMLATALEEMQVKDEDANPVAWVSVNGDLPDSGNIVISDTDSMMIKYSWDLLALNEKIIGGFSKNKINGTVSDGVTIDGFAEIGEGTVLLPGVFIEGNVIIGKNCKIGPNCYIRGNTAIGDNCHIGQAVEIKNSIFMNDVGAGHLSYIGDSIIGANSNFGAGTITANFRHDGKNHRSAVDGIIIDTGRRKFGTIFGDNVHTGIHTSIYPGRKIWSNMSTLPGDVVKKDIK